MSMQSTVALWLIPMVILASDGPSYGSPDLEVPWSQWQDSSERGGQNEQRDPPSPEPHYLPDTDTLFRKLDDLEGIGDKPDIGNFPSPGRSKSYSQPESVQVGPEPYIPRQDTGQEFLDPMDLKLMSIYDNAEVNSASDREFKRMMSLQRATDWDGKPTVAQDKLIVSKRATGVPKTKAKFFKTCPTSTSRPVSTRRSTTTTPASRSSIFCLPDPSPFRLATPKSTPAPPTIPTTIPTTSPPPPPPTSIPTASKVKPSKRRKKSKLLTPKTAKIVLEIILTTKQHALAVLKNLNYLEMEVLSQSADDCPLPDSQLAHSVPKKKKPKRLEKKLKPSSWTHSQAFFFGIRPASHRESVSDLAVAREEELKLQRRVWEEHKQQMRAMQSSKPRRFLMAPPAAVRLEAIKEPQVPQEPLEPTKPLKLPPNQDTSVAGDTGNPVYLPKAETKAIREENTP